MCVFCDISAGRSPAEVVLETDECLGFLDSRPLFPGHTLLIPRDHTETLPELRQELVAPLFVAVQLLSRAVPKALDAEGSFVAMNNKVSQSVPHLHVHVVPRNNKDGLKGFFWPRHGYRDEAHTQEVGMKIREAVAELA
jgi:histidine triad (HIT) family protein